MKRLKNIEDKNEEQLKMTENKKDNQLGIKSATDIIDEKVSPEAKNILAMLTNQENKLNTNGFILNPVMQVNLILESMTL